eukprot:7874261-Pyramimonas_sp.AAC.1
MRSDTLGMDIPLTRLGSGHRMAEIVRKLAGPAHPLPESARLKYPFLNDQSFLLKDGSPPEMLRSGELRDYIVILIILSTIIFSIRVMSRLFPRIQ